MSPFIEHKGQYIVTQCQSPSDALIATDRNDWAHANLAVVNDGYLHNFDPIEVPCGLSGLTLTNVEIEIEIFDISGSASCLGVPIFGNVLLNCPLTTSSICPIVQDVLSPGCAFGTGATTTGTYSLNLNTCIINPNANDIIGVDLIPATENLPSCPIVPDAVQSGAVNIDYEICITYTFFETIPDVCQNSVAIVCDDGDPCTVNDQEFVDECDNTLICVPCAGTLQSSCDDTLQLPCDDGDPCTIDDVQIVAVCDNSFVCEPCQGQLSADCNTTIELPCDDGNPCTENDFEIVSACDNDFVCEPCQGIPVMDCTSTQAISCDDGDPCTENDVYLIDVCNNNEICFPCQGTPVTPLDCSDGNCANGIEYWDDITCTCLIEETFLGCTDPTACNYDPLANCDFGCDYLCADCNGIPFGTAEIDSCGKCLEPDDVLFNLSCAIDLYLPNSFTPDGDGINDYFALKTPLDLSLFEIQVYNRFGQMVFQSSDPNFQWFGNGYRDEYYLPSDTYVYLISFSRNGLEIEQVRGHISIIR